MKVIFTRTGNTSYSTEVHRSDNVVLTVPPAGASSRMPHDLVHLVVEQHLNMDQGFWGCIATGAELRGMKVISGRRRPHAKERSRSVLRAAGQRLTEAEHMVTLFLELALEELDLRNPAAAQSRINGSWHAHDRPEHSLDRHAISEVCTAIRKTRSRWLGLSVGGSLMLQWPDGDSRKRKGRRRKSAAFYDGESVKPSSSDNAGGD